MSAGQVAPPGEASVDGLRARLRVRRSDAFVLDVELDVPPGRTTALVGPNGAGKSTVVAALAGLVPLDAGRIELDGAVLDDPAADLLVPPEERRVGVVFQDPLLFGHLSVLDNVAFGLRSRGMGRARASELASSWLERVRMRRHSTRRPPGLSGGQAGRVALARALATDPALLLLDEPLAALDVASRTELRTLLGEHLGGFAGPRLLVSHDPADAFELADEIVVLEEGRVTQRGSPDEIRLRPRTAYAAELAGSNLLSGVAENGTVETGGVRLVTTATEARGAVRVSIRPSAVAVHRKEPGGSPRNRWRTVVERLQDDGRRVRLLMGAPLPLMVDVTHAAVEELGLAPGTEVWLSVKATEVGVESGEPGTITNRDAGRGTGSGTGVGVGEPT